MATPRRTVRGRGGRSAIPRAVAEKGSAGAEAGGSGGAVAVVVIGRNEGARLLRCLRSVPRGPAVVYVDSGSDDGSPERAAALGADVVSLDPSRPFTAARARNEGFARLRALAPGVAFVQFVDGDCELREGWLGTAVAHLSHHPEVAVVCGRRRERRPEATPYNRLADLEWDTPVGDAEACGGDALFRATAFEAVGGFRDALIAGEEPELCLRLRERGWQVVRLDAEMTWHDAAMDRFSQWWRRQVRAGHAYAESAWLHGRGPEHFRVRQVASALGWGAALPGLALVAAPATAGASLGLAAAAYAALFWRIRRRRRDDDPRAATLYAAACVAGKLATAQGVALFAWNRGLRRRGSTLIEYKGSGAR